MTEKRTKEEVNYSLGMPQRHCGNCRHFIPEFRGKPYKEAACELVAGQIKPSMWCKLWERKK